MHQELNLSNLGHTWLLDLDGTIVKHNGYLIDGKDSFLPGAKEFLRALPKTDMVVFLTSRKEKYREITEQFLDENEVSYDHIIYDVPYGERILVNDDKPSGLKMSYAVKKKRDAELDITVIVDESL